MASSPPAPDLTVADEDVLECGVCFLPLKPPIFQCTLGHVLCSQCSSKLRDAGNAGKCHLCGVTGGYQRCHAMERVVDSVRSSCLHAPYGCVARPVYHALQEHVLECVHAPCHCPAGDFKGSIPALLEHIGSAHGWPCTTARYGAPSSTVHLRDGFNFFVSHSHNFDEHGRRYLYLLDVVRHAFCRAVSVIRICPRVPATKEVKLVLSYAKKCKGNETPVNDQFYHEQKIKFEVACSDLSDGLPDPHKCYQLIVSNYVLRDDGYNLIVVVKQIFPSS